MKPNKKSSIALILIIGLATFLFSGCKKDAILSGIVDIDGNRYDTVTIGTQTWMVQNLKTTRYTNGDPILSTTGDWSASTVGTQCAYNDNAENCTSYGRLYNWYAVSDSRKIAPAGWHVPTDDDWVVLTTFLGDEWGAGDKLKESGLNHWLGTNKLGTNEVGFTALPGGNRKADGSFYGMGGMGYWWSSTESEPAAAWIRSIYFSGASLSKSSNTKSFGFSVRCLKD